MRACCFRQLQTELCSLGKPSVALSPFLLLPGWRSLLFGGGALPISKLQSQLPALHLSVSGLALRLNLTEECFAFPSAAMQCSHQQWLCTHCTRKAPLSVSTHTRWHQHSSPLLMIPSLQACQPGNFEVCAMQHVLYSCFQGTVCKQTTASQSLRQPSGTALPCDTSD